MILPNILTYFVVPHRKKRDIHKLFACKLIKMFKIFTDQSKTCNDWDAMSW